MNGFPGSNSTTGTSVSLGGYNNGTNGQYRPRNGGLGGGSMYLHTNGNGPTVESSNMLISTMATPPSGNVRRPAAGRGYSKSFWHNLQQIHFWLLL